MYAGCTADSRPATHSVRGPTRRTGLAATSQQATNGAQSESAGNSPTRSWPLRARYGKNHPSPRCGPPHTTAFADCLGDVTDEQPVVAAELPRPNAHQAANTAKGSALDDTNILITAVIRTGLWNGLG